MFLNLCVLVSLRYSQESNENSFTDLFYELLICSESFVVFLCVRLNFVAASTNYILYIVSLTLQASFIFFLE